MHQVNAGSGLTLYLPKGTKGGKRAQEQRNQVGSRGARQQAAFGAPHLPSPQQEGAPHLIALPALRKAQEQGAPLALQNDHK